MIHCIVGERKSLVGGLRWPLLRVTDEDNDDDDEERRAVVITIKKQQHKNNANTVCGGSDSNCYHMNM